MGATPVQPGDAASPPVEPLDTGRNISKRRLWVFRGAAVLFGIALVALLEGCLIWLGAAEARDADDPFMGFQKITPLFVPDRTGQQMEISPARREWFQPESFARSKPRGEFRIFCLGGSTVQGNPYSIETSFTTWLELALQAAEPSRRWEVVNCGGISYASYRLAPILRELLNYEPDLFILCVGHNEFLEKRTYPKQQSAPAPLVTAHKWASHLRLYRLARSSAGGWFDGGSKPDQLSSDVDALLDYRGGLAHYHRDDAWSDGVMRHFHWNMDRMVAMAREQGIPVILIEPIADLKDTPPFKSEHAAGLTSVERTRFRALIQRAHQVTSPAKALGLLEQAVQIDERHSGVWFQMGKCYQALGRAAEARRCFVRAKEEDVCPLRIREPMYKMLRTIARDRDVPIVDARAVLEPRCELGIAGSEVMLDHVHPTIEGHQALALRLLDEMIAMRLLNEPGDAWHAKRKASFRAHLESLDEVYFARGKMRLEGLRLWSQGRSNKIKQGE